MPHLRYLDSIHNESRSHRDEYSRSGGCNDFMNQAISDRFALSGRRTKFIPQVTSENTMPTPVPAIYGSLSRQ